MVSCMRPMDNQNWSSAKNANRGGGRDGGGVGGGGWVWVFLIGVWPVCVVWARGGKLFLGAHGKFGPLVPKRWRKGPAACIPRWEKNLPKGRFFAPNCCTENQRGKTIDRKGLYFKVVREGGETNSCFDRRSAGPKSAVHKRRKNVLNAKKGKEERSSSFCAQGKE